ncbi:hypothetical protein D9758_014824 [Tetrapyrgos nigripes]|uniref:Uncharacterized protein n=1 Tax=Tetrapyrgos nigripes TaxID=182062 RepID=A0A8H5C563_9AGAR|nr:hypothetical protein D9758_014824 [Tetrapyrgos nigripes]
MATNLHNLSPPSTPYNSLFGRSRSSSLSADIESVLSSRKEHDSNNALTIHSNMPNASFSLFRRLSLSRSDTVETIHPRPDEISQDTPLQRAGTTVTSISGSSSQNSSNNPDSVRVVGRGGRGSRPRQKKPATTESTSSAWESSSTTDVQHDDHSSNAGTTALDPKPRVRVGGRGGAGSRPRVTLTSNSGSSEAGMKSIAALKVKWKGRRRSKTATNSIDVSPLMEAGSSSSHVPSSSTPRRPAISTSFSSSNPHPQASSSTLSPIHSGPPTPTQASLSSPYTPSLSYTSPLDSDSYSISSASTPNSVPLPLPQPGTRGYTHNVLSAPSKAERALGIVVPTIPDQLARDHHPSIKSHQDSLVDEDSIRYYRRASLPLSTLSSFIRTDSIVLDGGDDEDSERCWADNKYDSEKSDSNDGSLTPVSSIIFADRPPSPQPPWKRKATPSLVDAGTGLVLLRSSPVPAPSSPGDDYSLSEYTSSLNGDTATTDDYEGDSQSLFTPQPSLDLTPIIPETSHSPGEPVSPMVFSARGSMFISTGSKDDLHILQVRNPSTLDLDPPPPPQPQPDHLHVSVVPVRSRVKSIPTPSPAPPIAPPSKTGLTRAETINSAQFIRPDSPFMDYGTTNTFPRYHYDKRPTTSQSRAEHGWSGQWNRSDMQDVIHSLRMLK